MWRDPHATYRLLMRATSNSLRRDLMLLVAGAIFDPWRVAVLSTKDRIEQHAWRGAMRGNAAECVEMRGNYFKCGFSIRKLVKRRFAVAFGFLPTFSYQR